MTQRMLLAGICAAAALALSGAASAGPVFLTGHDPDFHAQDSAGAQDLLKAGLSYVTGGTYNTSTKKFLWVEASPADLGGIPGGHRYGVNGLLAIGLTAGVNFDVVDAATLAALPSFSGYSAIAVASSFGGILSQAELSELIARKSDIAAFVNGGGGLLALAECAPTSGSCLADTLGPSPSLYGFLPVTVSSIPPTAPFHVTAFGAGAPFNLTDGDVNDPTHNSFGLIGGLNPIDLDSGDPHQATTLAGNVGISDGGFVPTPEPASLALVGLGLAGLGLMRRKRAA